MGNLVEIYFVCLFFRMPTFNQVMRGARVPKFKKTRTPALRRCPFKKAVCIKVYTTTPKKPNSAIRKVAKVRLTSTKQKILAYVPGVGYSISQHSVVLVRGGRVRDVPGMHYKLVRGKFDFAYRERTRRYARRSKFGIPHDAPTGNLLV